MAKKALRFGVRSQHGQRSVTWRCWTGTARDKHDVYLTCRSIGKAAKVSLHQSGSWHAAFDQRFLDTEADTDNTEASSRYIDKWYRPPDIGVGLTLAYRIIVPYSSVDLPMNDHLPQSVLWIPAPPEDKAIEIAVILSTPEAGVGNWPGDQSMQTRLVGKLPLGNGGYVWVVYRVENTPSLSQERLKNKRMTKFKSGEGVSLSDPNLRAVFFGNAEDGSRFMIEGAVRLAPAEIP